MRPRAASPSGAGGRAPVLHAALMTASTNAAPARRTLFILSSRDIMTSASRREPPGRDDQRRHQIGEAARDPHDQAAELLILQRGETEDRRLPGGDIDRMRGKG